MRKPLSPAYRWVLFPALLSNPLVLEVFAPHSLSSLLPFCTSITHLDRFNVRVRSPVHDWNISKMPRNSGQSSEIRDQVLQWARESPEIAR